jgi:Nitronate monooxygenase
VVTGEVCGGTLPTEGHKAISSGGSARTLNSQLDAEEFHVEDTHHGAIRTEGSVHQRRHGVHCYQGSEAGGHNRATAATFSLLPAVIDAVPSVPVVASGGIADGRTVAAALALGALLPEGAARVVGRLDAVWPVATDSDTSRDSSFRGEVLRWL